MDDLLYTFADYARLCRHESAHVREWAFTHLVNQHPERAGEMAGTLVGDPDEDLAVNALVFLQAHPVTGLEGLLEERVSDSRNRVAREAIDALGELGDAEAVPLLTSVLLDPRNDDHLLGAADALVKLGPKGVQTVTEFMDRQAPGSFEHEVAFDALTHEPALSQLPRLVDIHLEMTRDPNQRSYLHHLASQTEVGELLDHWDDPSQKAEIAERVCAVSDALDLAPEEMVSPEFLEATKGLRTKDVTQVAAAVRAELARQRKSLPLPTALPPKPSPELRVVFFRATLIDELGTRLETGDPRPGAGRQLDLALLLSCLVVLKHDGLILAVPASGPERIDALVRLIASRDVSGREHWLTELAEHADECANRLCGLFEPGEDPATAARIARIIALTPRNLRSRWEPLIPELVACTGNSDDMRVRTWATTALQWLGPPVLHELETAFTSNEAGCQESLLAVLTEIPTHQSFELIRSRFDALVISWGDWPVQVLKALGHPETVALLAPRFSPDNFVWLEAMVVLCEVTGQTRTDLDSLRARYLARFAARKQDSASGEPPLVSGGRLAEVDPTAPRPVRLTLRCQECEAEGVYETERVLLSKGSVENPVELHLVEALPCRTCGADGLTARPRVAEDLLRQLQQALAHPDARTAELLQRVVPIDPYELDGQCMTPREGLRRHEEQVAAAPNDPEAHLELARTLAVLWRIREAAAAANRVLELKPDSLHARLILADLADRELDTAQAVRWYKEALTLARSSREQGWQEVIRVCKERLNQREQAPEAVRQARAAGPVGRNDPCPCGSGKKYKKCCLGKV